MATICGKTFLEISLLDIILKSEIFSDLRKDLFLVVVEQLFWRITCVDDVISMTALLRSANASC